MTGGPMLKPQVHRVQNWDNRLGPQWSPYVNRLRFVRWFFYHRFQKALEAAGQSPGARVLEFGCWQGYFLPSLLKNYGEVWAVDNDACSLVEKVPEYFTTLQMARALCQAEAAAMARLRLIKADGSHLPFRRGGFDLIFCLDTLPFITGEAKQSTLLEFGRILRPGGRLIISLPIEMGPVLLLRQALRRLSGAWRDRYSWRELLRAVCFRTAAHARPAEFANLKGYEYREDLAQIAAHFMVQSLRFLPCHGLGRLNPIALLACSTPPLDNSPESQISNLKSQI